MVISEKRSSPRIDLVFRTFRPDFMMISEKHLQQNETICAIFEGGRGNCLIRLTQYPLLPLSMAEARRINTPECTESVN